MSPAPLVHTPQPVRIGVIGGGLMGRELATTCGRWLQLVDHPARPSLVAVADPNPAALDWFRQVATVETLTDDWRTLVDDASIDVLYIAVPHHLHEEIYVAAARSGKDFLGEKPFGIDLAAAERIIAAIEASSAFVRASSEFPFFPGAQRAIELAASGALGEIVEVRSGFAHSSDIDRGKPINWKRRVETCGEIGVMGDLGLHVAHVPLRLGWRPASVYAMLDNIVRERSTPSGDRVACDTWDNALLSTWIKVGGQDVPMRLEMKRLMPGATNTWYIEILGTDGGVRYSTSDTKALWLFERGKEQFWKRTDLGFGTPFKAVTGGIFEPGFADVIQQMWAAYLMERAGRLDGRFGCATPEEAVATHEIFDAALRSQAKGEAVAL